MQKVLLVLSLLCAGRAHGEKILNFQEPVRQVAEQISGNNALANLARVLLAADPASAYILSGPRARVPMRYPMQATSRPVDVGKRVKMAEEGVGLDDLEKIQIGDDTVFEDGSEPEDYSENYDPFKDPQLYSETMRDPFWLAQFVDEHGMILPRECTGLSMIQQKRMAKLVKTARQMELLPYLAPRDENAGDDGEDEEEEDFGGLGGLGAGRFSGALGDIFGEMNKPMEPDPSKKDVEISEDDEFFADLEWDPTDPEEDEEDLDESMAQIEKEALKGPEDDEPDEEFGGRSGEITMKLQDFTRNKAAEGRRGGDVSMKVQDVETGVEKLFSRFGLPREGIHTRTDRRSAVGIGLASVALPLLAKSAPARAADGMFSLPPLPYAYDALEPHVDASTMKFHHDFHHQAYINNLNKAMAGKPEASLVSLMPGAKAAKLNNAGGGHYNHCLFWNIMGPKAGGAPTGVLAEKMTSAFGSFDDFKSQFSAAAAGVFGSGWAWLAVTKDGSVKIVTTPNQDNPLMEGATEAGLIPIMGIDVWEHAYYLKYQNRRPEYIAAFFNVINWDKVGEYYATAAEGTPISF